MKKNKERPIIFNTEMVQAILDGWKTQTRRVNGLEDVNNYPGTLEGESPIGELGYMGLAKSDYYIKNKKGFLKNPGLYHIFHGMQPTELNIIPVKCPYGQPGDHLWVRETWCWPFATEEMSPSEIPSYKKDEIKYRADGCKYSLWRPSIHMPRWASRITLEITNIRVERVRDIDYKDCFAEGINVKTADGSPPARTKLIRTFEDLWNSINAKRGFGWDANPWVWVVEFKTVDQKG